MADRPDVMLWLGDNTSGLPMSVAGPVMPTVTAIRARTQHPEAPSTCAHYAITDDHDYGPNNANGGLNKEWLLSISASSYLRSTTGT